MKNMMKRRKDGRSSHRMRLATAVAGVMLVFGSPVGASGWPVFDFSNLMQALYEYKNSLVISGADAAEYAEQIERWNRTREQFDQALIAYNAMQNFINLPPGAPLKPVDEDYLVKETCGSGEGISLTSLFETFVFKPKDDLKAQQKQICVNIRMMQNRKYNDSLMFLDKTMSDMRASQMRILGLRMTNNKQGTVQAVDSESARFTNDLQMAAQNWEGRMKSYDAYITVMQENQKVLAQTALKGDPTNRLTSDLIKTVSLKAALSIK